MLSTLQVTTGINGFDGKILDTTLKTEFVFKNLLVIIISFVCLNRCRVTRVYRRFQMATTFSSGSARYMVLKTRWESSISLLVCSQQTKSWNGCDYWLFDKLCRFMKGCPISSGSIFQAVIHIGRQQWSLTHLVFIQTSINTETSALTSWKKIGPLYMTSVQFSYQYRVYLEVSHSLFKK